MEYINTTPGYNSDTMYTVDLSASSNHGIIIDVSITRTLHICIVFLAFIVIILQVLMGMSMTRTIFLFVVYSLLMCYIAYIQYQYIPN